VLTAERDELLDGRWHFHHGPIDLVIGADGDVGAVREAHHAAWRRFMPLLDELVAELPGLRTPIRPLDTCPLSGPVARRMWHACHPYRDAFITPMAAVAGAVAEELIAFYRRDGISRAWVNNGGDIALHLTAQESVSIGLYSDLARFDERQLIDGPDIDGRFTVSGTLPVRGVATSGWRGRSFSLGIADSVTVLAQTAAAADAAATVIANAVVADDSRIVRKPANEIKDDSDLGDIAVTVEVPLLDRSVVENALRRGGRRACELRAAGLIWSAALVCQGRLLTTIDDDPILVQDRREVIRPLPLVHRGLVGAGND
jgi:uncharacterized protein